MCKIEMLRRVYGLSVGRTMQIWRTIGPVLEYGAEVWAERDWKQAEAKVVGWDDDYSMDDGTSTRRLFVGS